MDNRFERINRAAAGLSESTQRKLYELGLKVSTEPQMTLAKIISVYLALYYIIYRYLLVKKQYPKKKAFMYTVGIVLVFAVLLYIVPLGLRISIIHFKYQFWWAILLALIVAYYYFNLNQSPSQSP